MLNKKVIVACTMVIFLVASSLGLAYYTKDSNQNSKKSNEVAENKTVVKNESIAGNDENNENDKMASDQSTDLNSEAIKDSEQTPLSEKTKSLEQKRESLQTASRGGVVLKRNKTTETTAKSSEASTQSNEFKSEAKAAPVEKPAKPATNNSNYINGWSKEDYYWLAKIIYAESRGEPYEGQVAVGAVILRRVHHPDFPNTVYGVIFDKWDGKYYQFSPVADGSINLEPDETAYRAARDAMNGSDPSGGALYFYNPAKSTSKWIFSRPVLKNIGEHTFAL